MLMGDYRDTDLLAYILGGLVIAISGIAVGVASSNTSENLPDKAAVTVPTVVTLAVPQTSLANPSVSDRKGRETSPGHGDQVRKD